MAVDLFAVDQVFTVDCSENTTLARQSILLGHSTTRCRLLDDERFVVTLAGRLPDIRVSVGVDVWTNLFVRLPGVLVFKGRLFT